jgi:probable rRNA maturation factor
MQVVVSNRQRRHRIDRASVVTFAGRLLDLVPAPAADTLAVGLLSDRAVRALNRTYRGRDAATDVLAFPAPRRRPRTGERHLGDIAIAVPTAARQADRRGHSLQREIHTLLLHGYLHLLGHDHERDGGRMMRLQRRLERRLLGVRR